MGRSMRECQKRLEERAKEQLGPPVKMSVQDILDAAYRMNGLVEWNPQAEFMLFLQEKLKREGKL